MLHNSLHPRPCTLLVPCAFCPPPRPPCTLKHRPCTPPPAASGLALTFEQALQLIIRGEMSARVPFDVPEAYQEGNKCLRQALCRYMTGAQPGTTLGLTYA